MALGLVLASIRNQMFLEKLLKFVSKCAHAILILGVSRPHNCFEELPLQDYLAFVMDVIRGDSQLSVQSSSILFLFSVVVVGALFPEGVGLLLVAVVEVVELAHLVVEQESEVVLATLVVDPVELCDCCIRRGHLAISKEAPDLSHCH